MNLHDYLDLDVLHEDIVGGFVKIQPHPSYRLWIANYTNKAQFENHWTDVTTKTRGLIYSANEIVARPFPKFFNYGQLDRAMIPGGPIRVQDKLDGSLGILYLEPDTGKLAIATRGSFTSDQAVHATQVLRARYEDFQPLFGYTYLFEIIYPENRIVCDYGATDDLFLLDIINNETGRSHLDFGPVRMTWPGPVVDQFEFDSLIDVLNTEPREGAEGFVVYFYQDGSRLKVKQEEYVRLHRLLTGVSNKTIWEILANGGDLEEILDRVPDEYYHWVRNTAGGLIKDFNQVYGQAQSDYTAIINKVLYHEDIRDRRKAFARLAVERENSGLLFGLYDGKDVSEAVWKIVRPGYAKPFWNVSEDVA